MGPKAKSLADHLPAMPDPRKIGALTYRETTRNPYRRLRLYQYPPPPPNRITSTIIKITKLIKASSDNFATLCFNLYLHYFP
jgi:hypothetical protein